MYLLEFDKDLTVFEWTKVQIASTGARAFHSSSFVSDDIFLSSTKTLLVGDNKLAYFGT